MTSRVLLAGATGSVGAALLVRLREEGHWTRTLSRRADAATKLRPLAHDVVVADATRGEGLEDVAAGCDVVVSCLGANVTLGLRERRSYWEVDRVANENLLRAAEKARVRRFVYVSVFVTPDYAATRYVRAHEAFVRTLRSSRLSSTVIRPTGLYSGLAPVLEMAQHGRAVLIGNGSARTNPIDPRDVAELCLRHLHDGPEEIEAGGPDVFSRRDIATEAFEVVGASPSFREVPPWALRALAYVVGPLHPRLSDLLEFATRVSTHDALAPDVGGRHLRDYFAEFHGGPALAVPSVPRAPTNGQSRRIT